MFKKFPNWARQKLRAPDYEPDASQLFSREWTAPDGQTASTTITMLETQDAILLEQHSMGSGTQEAFGREDVEYHLSLPRSEKARILPLIDRFLKDAKPGISLSKLADLCEAEGIPAKRIVI